MMTILTTRVYRMPRNWKTDKAPGKFDGAGTIVMHEDDFARLPGRIQQMLRKYARPSGRPKTLLFVMTVARQEGIVDALTQERVHDAKDQVDLIFPHLPR